MLRYSFLLFFTLLFLNNTNAQIQIGNTTVDTSTVISGLDIPWEIHLGPDGWLWTTERYGRVSRINPETGEQDIILDINEIVTQRSESGLLGLTLHPDFANTPEVFLVYTFGPTNDIKERLVKYTYENGQLVSPVTLIDNIPGNSTHNGSRLVILPDNTLLMTTGDAKDEPGSQDLSKLSGKILRLNLDGSIPIDNPFPSSYIYSLGHRNAQGLALSPKGIIYSSEHGPNTDDEFQIIEEGENYGWPNVKGFCNTSEEMAFCNDNDVVEPLVAWTPTIATSDIAYYNNDAIPEWKNTVLMTVLKNKRLTALKLSEDGKDVVSQEDYLIGTFKRLRDIAVAEDGTIYLATNGDSWNNNNPFTHRIVKLKSQLITSTYSITNSDAISLFPNPANDIVHVKGTFEKIKIFNSNGKSVIETSQSTFSTENLLPGVYSVVFELKEGTNSQKLIIK